MSKMTKADLIRNYDKEHPGATAAQAAKALKLHPSYVWLIRSSDKKKAEGKQPSSKPTNGQLIVRDQMSRLMQENEELKRANDKLVFLVTYLESKVGIHASV